MQYHYLEEISFDLRDRNSPYVRCKKRPTPAISTIYGLCTRPGSLFSHKHTYHSLKSSLSKRVQIKFRNEEGPTRDHGDSNSAPMTGKGRHSAEIRWNSYSSNSKARDREVLCTAILSNSTETVLTARMLRETRHSHDINAGLTKRDMMYRELVSRTEESRSLSATVWLWREVLEAVR